MKKFYFILFIMLYLSPALLAQCADECKGRFIRVYDFDVTLAPLTESDPTLINAYYNALRIAPSVVNHLQTSDPMRECLWVSGGGATASLTYDQATSNWRNLQWLANSQTHSPSGSTNEEYYITGSVQETTVNDYAYVGFALRVYAKNGDLIAVAVNYFNYDLPYQSLPAFISEVFQQQIGTLYIKLYSYEAGKRDGGEPYAIGPELILTPERQSMDAGETTKIKIKLTDCDDVALANRTVEFDHSSIGTINPLSVITDGNGEASVDFTANVSTGLAVLTAKFHYQHPWEDQDKIYSEETSININKPSDAWFLYAKRDFNESRYSRTKMSNGPTNSSESHKNEDCYLFAWVKLDKMITGFPPYIDTTFITMSKKPLAVEVKGGNHEFGSDDGYFSNEAGYIKDEGWFNATATYASYAAPEVYVNISANNKADDTYSLNFTKLAATRTGRYHSFTETYIIYQGTTTEVSDTDADTSAALNWNAHNAMHDTSYSDHSDDGNTVETSSVSQKVVWVSSSAFRLNYQKHFISETNYEAQGLEEYSKWIQDYDIEIELFYDMPTVDVNDFITDVPKSYSLYQNYPNPFNPSTVINYELPVPGIVTLKIFDLLGNEVATLVNEDKPAGKYKAEFNASKLTSGVYFCQLRAGNFIDTRKMMLLK